MYNYTINAYVTAPIAKADRAP